MYYLFFLILSFAELEKLGAEHSKTEAHTFMVFVGLMT